MRPKFHPAPLWNCRLSERIHNLPCEWIHYFAYPALTLLLLDLDTLVAIPQEICVFQSPILRIQVVYANY
jgi:hypothetical protein